MNALRNIGKIRKYIDQEECERLVHAFITSKRDSCNSILFGLPAIEVEKLQRAQNTVARLVVRSKKNEHITPVLKRLHCRKWHFRDSKIIDVSRAFVSRFVPPPPVFSLWCRHCIYT